MILVRRRSSRTHTRLVESVKLVTMRGCLPSEPVCVHGTHTQRLAPDALWDGRKQWALGQTSQRAAHQLMEDETTNLLKTHCILFVKKSQSFSLVILKHIVIAAYMCLNLMFNLLSFGFSVVL